MNPALSVIFFTTLSGAGYGLLMWTAVAALFNQPSKPLLVSSLLALALITIGLLSSLAHLGQPQRAWRALSQWRTSWLSREGVASLATYLPALMLGVLLFFDWIDPTSFGLSTPPPPLVLVICVWLIVSALATVACTAMIYASLKPVPAWRHWLVLPVYLLFALSCGGLLLLAMLSWHGMAMGNLTALCAVTGVMVLALCKLRYWSDIDATPLPATRGDAVGLPARTVTVFERPHTQANYLTREMAFVLARQHSQRLRWLSMVLFALVPMLCLLLAWMYEASAGWLGVAALSALAGAFVERWLFFAEARHLVTLYY